MFSTKAKFSFPECEKMGVNQPKRCARCEGCNQCSEKGLELTRKEKSELKLIEDNMFLHVERKCWIGQDQLTTSRITMFSNQDPVQPR